jgi:hypothetical protein
VKRVLLTGMSGTGKSTVIGALAACGYKAVDTDDGWCEPLPDGRQKWREDAIEQLLAIEDADVLRGSYHLHQGIGPFIGNVIMGVLFGVLFLRWRRTNPMIIAHTLINSVAFIGYTLLAGHVSWLP